MSQDVEGFETSRLFFDDENFPHGFNKSGDFTIRESQLLSSYGSLLKDLHLGNRQAGNDIQERFIAVCRGTSSAESPLEKVWLKYLDKSNRKILVPRSRLSANDTMATTYIDDIDADIDL